MWTPWLRRPMGWVVLESRGAWQLRGLEVRRLEFLMEEVRTAGILGRLRQLKPSGGLWL